MNVDIDITGIELETESLILRPFNENDLNDFYEYAKVEGVGELAGWKHHQSLEETKEILNMFIEKKSVFGIIEKKSNKLIGSIEIKPYKEEIAGKKYDKLRASELGYTLNKDFWGQGYMPQAANAVLQYCFETLQLDVMFCGYFKRNTQSKRVSEKLGFTYLTDQILHTRYGTIEDSILTVLTKEAWLKRVKS